MWINYPNNPTGAVAGLDYFAEVVDFAKANDILVMHDACYTEVAYDGHRPVSFLQVPGAMDVALEFHSLSKSYNMTGWRLGVAVGNAELIDALMVVKSQPGLRGASGHSGHGHRGPQRPLRLRGRP